MTLSDGARVVLRREGNPEGPRLLASHGTGFAIDGFRRLWEPLRDVCDLVLFDLRCHGRNPPHDPSSVCRSRLDADMAEIVAGQALAFGMKPAFGLFHSISALMALRLESSRPGSFAGLVLMEPPAVPPPDHPEHAAFEAGRLALATRSAKRQATFASVGGLAEKFTARGPFRHFESGAADELAASMLVRAGDGFRLACPPEAESRYYGENADDGLFDRLGRTACPIVMVVGRDDLDLPGTPARVAADLARRGGYDLVELAAATHLMPLERPRAVAALTRGFVGLHTSG